MDLKQQLQSDMATAMREGDVTRRDTLRMLIAAIKQEEVDRRVDLDNAGVEAGQVDYINLHGTASRINDSIETLALGQLLTMNTLASSTKGWTGHCLGAAGILETVITLEAMRRGRVPA